MTTTDKSEHEVRDQTLDASIAPVAILLKERIFALMFTDLRGLNMLIFAAGRLQDIFRRVRYMILPKLNLLESISEGKNLGILYEKKFFAFSVVDIFF